MGEKYIIAILTHSTLSYKINFKNLQKIRSKNNKKVTKAQIIAQDCAFKGF